MSPDLLNAVASVFARWSAEASPLWPGLREALGRLHPTLGAAFADATWSQPAEWLAWLEEFEPAHWEALASSLSDLLSSLDRDHPLARELEGVLMRISNALVDALSGSAASAGGGDLADELGPWLDAVSAWCVDTAMRGWRGPSA